MKQLSYKISAYLKDSMFTQPIVKDILDLLEEQYPSYKNFDFLGYSFESLTLKTTNKDQQSVLKIVIIQDNNIEEIEQVKKKYDYLRRISKSCSLIGINNSFYLLNEQKEQYFVIDMELCKCSLSQFLEESRKDKVILEDRVKEILTIQLLDILNLLHNKEILHRDVRPDNIFISFQPPSSKDNSYLLKIGDLGLAPQHKVKNWKSFIEGKKGTESYMSIEASQGRQLEESDLYSLGIVILELDNYLTFEYYKVQKKEERSLQEKGIKALSNFQLNRKSFLYKIAEIFINPDFRKRCTAFDILERFLMKQQHANILLYSIFTEQAVLSNSQLPIFDDFLDKKNQQKTSFNLLVGSFLNKNNKYGVISNEELNDHDKLQRLIRNQVGMNLLDKVEESNFISSEKIQLALKALYSSKKFTLFSYLGRRASGEMMFSAQNMECQRDSIILISLANDKVNIMKKVCILKKIVSPYIAKFYDFQFFQDELKNEYVWYEFEKCKCTLSHYLNLHKEEINRNTDLKLSFALQIIDSINILHRSGILHGDIQLQSFMISEDKQGKEIVKLSNFDSLDLLSSSTYESDNYDNKCLLLADKNCLFLRGMYGSPVFRSPEKQFCYGFPSTFTSESFSVGLCLLLLDNYLSFNKVLSCNYFDLLSPYSIPFKNYHHLLNTKSLIYKWAISLLAYHPGQRLLLRQIADTIKDSETALYSKFNSQIPLKEGYLKSPCLYLRQLECEEVMKIINQKSAQFQTSLSSLAITDLKCEDLFAVPWEQKSIQIFQAISQLSNLTSIELDLSNKSVENQQIISLSSTLSKLSLSSLVLNLQVYDLQNDGPIQLLSAISKQVNLQSLALKISSSKIQSKEMNQLSSTISKLRNLSSLAIQLSVKNIKNEEEICLSLDLSNLIYLSSLMLKLSVKSYSKKQILILSLDLSSLISLQSLALIQKRSNIKSEEISRLSSSTSKLINLSSLTLDLSGINFLKEEMDQLSSSLSELVQLSSLKLSLKQSSIKKEKLIQLYLAISKLTQLISLSLNMSRIYFNLGIIEFSTSISKLKKLQSLALDLSNNSQDFQMEQFSSTLSKFIYLSCFSLNIESNQIKSEDVIQLSQAIAKLINLQSLTLLSECNLSSEGIIQLSSAISKLIQLQSLTLNIQGSNVQNEEMIQFSSAISKLINLSSLTLYLSSSNISNEGMIQLSSAFSQPKYLLSLTLYLSDKTISRDGMMSLSQGISQLIKLSLLKLLISHNANEKQFKDAIESKLSHVKELNISFW